MEYIDERILPKDKAKKNKKKIKVLTFEALLKM